MKNTKSNAEKPTKEAKALSLFLMAYKSINSTYKEEAKRMNKRWDLVKNSELSKADYQKEVENRIEFHGGYTQVIQKTVKFYIDKTGAWSLKGDDQYCSDANQIAASFSKQ